VLRLNTDSIVQRLVAEPLRFPRGVRFLEPGEVPAGGPPDTFERLKTAHITTGYVCHAPQKTGAMPLFEANAHADRVWLLVKAIAESILPAAAAPIFGLKNEDPILGPYTSRAAAIGVFEPFVESLQHDGLLEFGIIFQRAGKTNEVFVRSAKYLQMWTTYPKLVRRLLESHGLPEVPNLQFIDNYPRVSETISLEDGRAGWPIVYEELQRAFASLPRAPDLDIFGA